MAPPEHPSVTLSRWLARVQPTFNDKRESVLGERASALGLYTTENAELGPASDRCAPEHGHMGLAIDLVEHRTQTHKRVHDAVALGVQTVWLDAGRFGCHRSAWTRCGVQVAQELLRETASTSTQCVLNAGGIRGDLLATLEERLCESEHVAVVGDPLATLAQWGELESSLKLAVRDLATSSVDSLTRSPSTPTVCVSVLPYHDAGASVGEELGLALSTAVHYLRALEAVGLSVEKAARGIVFRIGVGPRVLDELAKLRAARLVWARLLAACRVEPGSVPMTIHGVVSSRTFSTVDPWNNILRATVASTAAHLGGSDVVYHTPMDALDETRHRFAERLAINSDSVLRLEAGIDRVADPSAGSYAIESMTHRCARSAWQAFREFEAAGGIVAVLESGSMAERLADNARAVAQQVAAGEITMVGVNRYQRSSWPRLPVLDDSLAPPATSRPDDAPPDDGTTEMATKVAPIRSVRPAAVVEHGGGAA